MKIWGVSYGLVGDLIMGLPILTYFEKKYKGSYKYWVIEGKCKNSAPLFEGHPLINEVYVMKNDEKYSKSDIETRDKCDIFVPKPKHFWHEPQDWYNYRSCVEETARTAGIEDIKEVLTEEEMIPKLYRTFDVKPTKEKVISIWPFSKTVTDKRSPNVEWWKSLVSTLIEKDYIIKHFGLPNEPRLFCDDYKYNRYISYDYFDQVKISLSTRLSICTDSGSGWVMGAYNHPTIYLITNWLPNHNKNLLSLAPVNPNGINILSEGGWGNLSTDRVIKEI